MLAVAAGAAVWVGPRANTPSALASNPPATPVAPEKTRWRDLTPAQQTALEPLAGEWDKTEPIRKQKWLAIAKRYTTMKPDEQVRVQERMREWVRMTPEERRQVRENFTRAQKVDPSKKSTQWESYQQLSDEQKKELAARAANRKQLVNLATPSQARQPMPAPIKPPPAQPALTPWIDPATGQPWPDASNVTPVPPAIPTTDTPPVNPDASK
ncbi:MAG: DUF3106 domain-containing protein [Duganella sp.]